MKDTFSLTINETNAIKGVALLMLLCHHLFYIQRGYYDDIHITGDHFLVQTIGIFCKVCVAIFVFLSGYGLVAQAIAKDEKQSIKKFYWHRFVKLYANYWFIWLVFVPFSIFVFGRTLTDAYGTMIIPKFILDFFGILNCFGIYGYNPTWWFYSCIIVLYICFPFLYKLLNYSPFILLALIMTIYFIPIPQIISIKIYFASFVLGMALCKFSKVVSAKPSRWWIVLLLVLAIERFCSSDIYLFDAVLALAMVMAYKSCTIPTAVTKCLELLGKHSLNIFLFHSFIYYYWFPIFIYYTRNPFLIFVSLLSSCVVISYLLELLKKSIRFNLLVNRIDSIYGIR